MDSPRLTGIIGSDGIRFDHTSHNRAALPANGGNFAKQTKKVENYRHAVIPVRNPLITRLLSDDDNSAVSDPRRHRVMWDPSRDRQGAFPPETTSSG